MSKNPVQLTGITIDLKELILFCKQRPLIPMCFLLTVLLGIVVPRLTMVSSERVVIETVIIAMTLCAFYLIIHSFSKKERINLNTESLFVSELGFERTGDEITGADRERWSRGSKKGSPLIKRRDCLRYYLPFPDGSVYWKSYDSFRPTG